MHRILVLTPFPPPPDGIGTHSEHLVDAWARAGAQVLVLTQGVGGEREEHGAFAVERTLGPRLFDHAFAVASDFEPDLVFCQFAISALTTSVNATLKICRRFKDAGTPVAMAFHEPLREIALLGPIGRWIYGRALAACTAPITFSTGATEALAFAPGSQLIAQLPHGIPALVPPTDSDIARVRAAYGLDGPFILNFGFIHPDKGVDVLIAAARQLHRRDGGHVQMVIAGRPRKRSSAFKIFGLIDQRHYGEIRQAAAGLPESVQVSFPPYLPDDDLGALLAAASVVVLPYRRTTQSGVASFVLAAGAPAVVTSLPGLEGAFGDAACYARPDDPVDLARALNEVLDDEELQVQLHERSLARAATEAYDDVARMILEAGIGSADSDGVAS